MLYFTVEEALYKGNFFKYLNRKPQQILKEEFDNFDSAKTYDIFLSHSYADAGIVLGAAEILRDVGYTVYIDWIEDAHLDRKNVTKAVADLIRKRMRACKWLFFATSDSSPDSKWMPWELGYFDGYKPNCVAILPLMKNRSTNFKGQEYLSLYPIITKGLSSNSLGIQNPIEINIYDGKSEKLFKMAG